MGHSASLPECRAYELVTPADTNGLRPYLANYDQNYMPFPSAPLSSSEDSVLFHTIAGTLSGFEGNGLTDRYRAVRTPKGWVTELFSPTGGEARLQYPGGIEPSHNSYFIADRTLNTGDEGGTLVTKFGGPADMLRTPDGEYELVGKGILGESRWAGGLYISPGSEHVIFSSRSNSIGLVPESPVQLEPNAPEEGTEALYDRGLGGPTHVVSLLPGNITPAPGQDAIFQGVSKDGTAIAFRLVGDPNLYVRMDSTTTKTVVTESNVESVGTTLHCAGAPSTATLAYRWLRNGAPIAGETERSYTTTGADSGTAIQCEVTATTAEGTVIAISRASLIAPLGPTAPPESGGLQIFGEMKVGETITCFAGEWSGEPTLAYQWLRNGVPIPSETNEAYTLTASDHLMAIQCQVTGTNAGGATVDYSAAQVPSSSPPTNTGSNTGANPPKITGTATVGSTLTCSNGAWVGATSFSYQWRRNGSVLAGSTADTYTVTEEDAGTAIQCQVKASNADGTATAFSANLVIAPVPSPLPPTRPNGALPIDVVVGSVRAVGKELRCSRGNWGQNPTSFVYQWLRNGQPIPGSSSGPTTETDFGYTPVAADLDKVVQCQVTATNASGSSVVTSAPSAAALILRDVPAAKARLLEGITPAGISSDGKHVFYANASSPSNEDGDQTPADLFSFDTETDTTTQITTVGDAQFVDVAEDGSRVYFVSRSQIGGEGVDGQPNLYLWEREGGSANFIGTLDPADVTLVPTGSFRGEPNMVRWTSQVISPTQRTNYIGPGKNAARSTADGSVLVFESRASLAGANNNGRVAVYRYDAAGGGSLACVSCRPGGAPSQDDSTLQSVYERTSDPVNPVSAPYIVTNVTADGETVFFQSKDSLVAGDTGPGQDVYRWKDGEVALLSSGGGIKDSFLYAASADGSDVLIHTYEHLLPEDRNVNGAIYDARIGGGFPSPAPPPVPPCAGEACQAIGAAPSATETASSTIVGKGNVKSRHGCGKGKRLVRRAGKARCVKRPKRTRQRQRRVRR